MTIAAELHAIADRLAPLAPSHRDPHRFHEDKSELVAKLRRLANERKTAPVIANDNNPKRRTA